MNSFTNNNKKTCMHILLWKSKDVLINKMAKARYDVKIRQKRYNNNSVLKPINVNLLLSYKLNLDSSLELDTVGYLR